MSDLDSLLVELESSIERRVTSSSTTTCTRVTVETGCEDTSSITRQQPRSDSQLEWPAQSVSQARHPSLWLCFITLQYSTVLSYRIANISCSTAAPAVLQAWSLQSFNCKNEQTLSRAEQARELGRRESFIMKYFHNGCWVAPVLSHPGCYLSLSLSLSLSPLCCD